MKSRFFLFLITVHWVACSLPSISETTNWIGHELEKTNHDEFNLDMFTKQWMDTCEANNNGTNAIEEMQNTITALSDCISSKINLIVIAEEMKEAIPKGTLDEVFIKYCNHVSELRQCRIPVIKAIQVCLSDQGDRDLEVLDAAIDGALDFMCYKGGERIAIFMSENGTDCFLSKSDAIATCLNGTLPDLEAVLLKVQTTNASLFDQQNCQLEERIKWCIVNEMVTCSDPTPANVIEGLIDFMLKKTPCQKSASWHLSPSFTLVLLLSALIAIQRLTFNY